MKKHSNTLICASLVVLAVACVKEKVSFEPVVSFGDIITETLTARVEEPGGTKAEITSGGEFVWNTGDQIAVHVDDGNYYISSPLTVDDINGNQATFSVSGYLSSNTRDCFAIFPHTIVETDAANYGQDGFSLDVTLPNSYPLSKVSGTKTPCPMIADNTGSDWAFKQLCGLLRLTVSGIPTDDGTYLKIDFDGHQVSGAFSIASAVTPGTSTIETSTGSSNDIIKITDLDGADEVTINIPIPTGDYGDIIVSAWNSSDVPVKANVKVFGYTSNRARGKILEAALSPGIFSVGAGKYAVFAPGNLESVVGTTGYSIGVGGTGFSPTKWYFASSQYEFNTAEELNGNTICDHFGWVGINADSDIIDTWGAFYNLDANECGNTIGEAIAHDWGENVIYLNSSSESAYAPGTWRTPKGRSGGEWIWIVAGDYPDPGVNCRTSSTVNEVANARCTKATVNGIPGLILFPDQYSHPALVNLPTNINIRTGLFDANIYSSADWVAMESAGAVFLPAAGFRYNGTWVYPAIDTGGLGHDSPIGYYWSSSAETLSDIGNIAASDLYFFENNINPLNKGNRANAYAVRLIRDIK